MATAFLEDMALAQDSSDLLEVAASAGLQSVSGPADGMNDKDSFQETLRATAKAHRALAAGRQGSGRGNISCVRCRCA